MHTDTLHILEGRWLALPGDEEPSMANVDGGRQKHAWTGGKGRGVGVRVCRTQVREGESTYRLEMSRQVLASMWWEGRTMNFHVEIQHGHMVSEFQWT